MTNDIVFNLIKLSAVFCYFFVLFLVAFFSYKKNLTNTDFIIGNRSLNFWLTALAAHASDMSSWLFLAYPAMIFTLGLHQAWSAIGLIVFMFLNWQLIAKKVRTATEQYGSLTFSSFFENRLADTTGYIRLFTALMQFVFYTIYISAALQGLGLLFVALFGIPYYVGTLIGIFIVIPYVFSGGYLTLAWIDLFQGLFLMIVILFVPLYIWPSVGGWGNIMHTMKTNELMTSLLPLSSPRTLVELFFLAIGWGLGYFGQPHIVTKFMGIKNVTEIQKSKWIGMSWMVLSLGAATLVGLVGIAFFPNGLRDPQQVFLHMVNSSFSPFVIGLIICAVLAATINAMSSMVLVLSSSLTEDFYKKFIHRHASQKHLLIMSRIGVVIVSVLAFIIASFKLSTINQVVLYAWSGLGASFGPLLLFSLYSKSINRYGAWAGILTGGITSAVWFFFQRFLPIDILPLTPAFILSCLSIWIVSYLKKEKITVVPD